MSEKLQNIVVQCFECKEYYKFRTYKGSDLIKESIALPTINNIELGGVSSGVCSKCLPGYYERYGLDYNLIQKQKNTQK